MQFAVPCEKVRKAGGRGLWRFYLRFDAAHSARARSFGGAWRLGWLWWHFICRTPGALDARLDSRSATQHTHALHTYMGCADSAQVLTLFALSACHTHTHTLKHTVRHSRVARNWPRSRDAGSAQRYPDRTRLINNYMHARARACASCVCAPNCRTGRTGAGRRDWRCFLWDCKRRRRRRKYHELSIYGMRPNHTRTHARTPWRTRAHACSQARKHARKH